MKLIIEKINLLNQRFKSIVLSSNIVGLKCNTKEIYWKLVFLCIEVIFRNLFLKGIQFLY